MIDMANDSQKPARRMTERQANKALTDARRGVNHSSYWIAELVDRNGWKALGFSTAEAFGEEEMGLSRSTLFRILDQGRMIRRLSGGDLKRLKSYALSQRHAETLKRAPAAVLDEAGQRIADGEEPGKVVEDVLAFLNSPPEIEEESREWDSGTSLTSGNTEEGDAQTGTEAGEEPAAPQPEDGTAGKAPTGTSDSPEDPSPQPDPPPAPPSPPEPPGDGSTEDDEQRARLEAVREENKAIMALIRGLLQVDVIVGARAAKRSVLAEVEGWAKRAQQANTADGSRVVLLAADLVSRFPALPSEPFDAGVNRAIRDLLAEVERLRQPAPVQPAPTPPAATKVKPAAVKKAAPKPKAVKRPKKGEPCPHPREAHVGVDMRGVTCSWCDAKALTHASLERMGQRAVTAR